MQFDGSGDVLAIGRVRSPVFAVNNDKILSLEAHHFEQAGRGMPDETAVHRVAGSKF